MAEKADTVCTIKVAINWSRFACCGSVDSVDVAERLPSDEIVFVMGYKVKLHVIEDAV